MPSFSITRENAALEVHCDSVTLGRYVFAPGGDPFEGPKPFLHPIRTLGGSILTGFRPWDHRWHKGLQMTLTDVSGQNFWGGNTYVRGEGYQALDNVGTIRHDDFEALSDGASASVAEGLTWIASTGEHLLDEHRTMTFHDADTATSSWVLDFDTELANVSGHDLVLGSPATNGREGAGYSGLFWRLPRSFTGGRITVPTDTGSAHDLSADQADTLLGSRTPWIAFHGQYDGTDEQACVLALLADSHLSTAGCPTVPNDTAVPKPRWFVRSVPYPGLASSPSFSETLRLMPGQTLTLQHRFVLLDGNPDEGELTIVAKGNSLERPDS